MVYFVFYMSNWLFTWTCIQTCTHVLYRFFPPSCRAQMCYGVAKLSTNARRTRTNSTRWAVIRVYQIRENPQKRKRKRSVAVLYLAALIFYCSLLHTLPTLVIRSQFIFDQSLRATSVQISLVVDDGADERSVCSHFRLEQGRSMGEFLLPEPY